MMNKEEIKKLKRRHAALMQKSNQCYAEAAKIDIKLVSLESKKYKKYVGKCLMGRENGCITLTKVGSIATSGYGIGKQIIFEATGFYIWPKTTVYLNNMKKHKVISEKKMTEIATEKIKNFLKKV